MTLRDLRSDDVEAIVDYSNDPVTQRWTPLPSPYQDTHARAWLAKIDRGWADGSRYQFGIETAGRLVGDVNLRPQGAGLAEVGYALAGPARGRGLMTRALRLLLAWGFSQTPVEVVHWRAHVGNWPSRRVAWAVGFRVYGAVPGLLEYQGRRVDGWIGALHRGERLSPAHDWLDPELILGRRINLRGHRDDDVPRIVAGCRDPQTAYWLGQLPADYSEQDARRHLERIKIDQAGGHAAFWAVSDPDDDRMLGEIRIVIRDPHHQHGEIGYWTHPQARGAGLMTEAVTLAVRHALLPAEEGGLGLNRMLLRAAVGNQASIRVAQKAGFTRSGIDRAGDRLGNAQVVDVVRFDLLADELPAVR